MLVLLAYIHATIHRVYRRGSKCNIQPIRGLRKKENKRRRRKGEQIYKNNHYHQAS
jgi:hypothetical protein